MNFAYTRGVFAVALASSALTCVAAPAMAQDADSEAAVADSGDIIVTARRRQESLQDTPVAVTAINAAMIETKAAVNIGDLAGTAPNLIITNQNSGAAAANLSIRGLTYADVEKSQEPTVGVVVDGVFIGTSTGQFFDFFDIEQIEVLRGPQGTLFGRNTIGGVINIRRTRPTGEFGVKAEVSYGKYDSLATRAVVNIPVVPDIIAAKLFYFHNETDGWYKQFQDGRSRGFGNNENFGGSILVTPNDSLDILLTGEKQVQKADPVVSNLTNSTELFCGFIPAIECNRNNRGDLYTVFGDPNVSKYSAPAVTAEANLRLGGVTLTSVTGYRTSTESQTQDFDASSVDLYYVLRGQDYKQFSQELRAAGDLGFGLDYVVGAYYFSSSYDLLQYTRL
ncbi:TonB-dependent receptor [Novosphingobium aquimarinum]|uniref:TonB-dependent receptor n=1 Tax=Novosphingobium aquimarinum TaxID=2682494 RepID=UPI0012ECA031